MHDDHAPDLGAARRFLTTQARLLDRHRFALLLGEAPAEQVLAALEGYRNSDGGYGHGLEPDLRAPESQPAGALHALEAIADAAPLTSTRATALCDWLARVSLPDGGLPFALPMADATACAPFWASADPQASSLQITAAVAAMAWRVAAHDPAVAEHPWLVTATRFCVQGIAELGQDVHAYELLFALRFLEQVYGLHPDAPALLERLGGLVPPSGVLPVAGGAPEECLRPLDLAPLPGSPVRRLLDEAGVEADLDRLCAGQRDDGGWTVDFDSSSPAAAMEWRGCRTVEAVRVLLANGRLGLGEGGVR